MDETIKKILERIEKAGYKAYIVGGAVRDYLMNNKSNLDVDIATDAPVNVLQFLFANKTLKPLKYDTVKFKLGNYHIDIAHFRKEELANGVLNVEFTDSLYEDSLRRDFTINAIYIDINLNKIDYHNGVDDCKNHVLRFIGDPITRLEEDPSRILRYLYFLVRYDLEYVEEEYNNIKKYAIHFLSKCSSDDINKYIVKILDLNSINKFVSILNSLGIYEFFFNEDITSLNPFDLISKSNYKFYDLLPKRYKNNDKSLN